MLQGGGPVTLFGLNHLVGFPAALHGEHGQILALVGQQEFLADQQSKRSSVSNTIGRPNSSPLLVRWSATTGVVVLLVHEAPQG